MSKSITALNTANPFSTLYTAANTLIQVLANEIVTANTVGATTSGNGFVIGYFGANTIVATTLQGGNVGTLTNLSLATNLVANSTSLLLTGNNNLGYPINMTTTGATTQVVDSFLIANYRSAEYILSITDNNNNNYQLSKILVLQSGSNAYLTEYGIVISNSAMG